MLRISRPRSKVSLGTTVNGPAMARSELVGSLKALLMFA